MTEAHTPSQPPAATVLPPAPVAVATAPEAAASGPLAGDPGPQTVPPPRWQTGLAVGLGALVFIALGLAWNTQQRVHTLEQELVRRQESSQSQAMEARLLARQAHDTAADVAAKLGLLDARVAETALQRSQVEELIQSMSRSRDENVLADVEAALRVAQQQAAITGSPEPLIAVLRQSEERMARYNQPRLERVRRAMARDLDKARAVAAADLPTLSIRLDEAVRLMDELPMVNQPERRVASGDRAVAPAPQRRTDDWHAWARQMWSDAWAEVRGLVRVSRIDHPEAMLTAPDQAFFLRENLKLRLLNARLALMSRQFDQARTDLAAAESGLERYFDRNSRRVVVALELVRQVSAQSRQVVLPRPDETFAALATAAAGR